MLYITRPNEGESERYYRIYHEQPVDELFFPVHEDDYRVSFSGRISELKRCSASDFWPSLKDTQKIEFLQAFGDGFTLPFPPTRPGESRRFLAWSVVAGTKYAESALLDNLGTADDYDHYAIDKLDFYQAHLVKELEVKPGDVKVIGFLPKMDSSSSDRTIGYNTQGVRKLACKSEDKEYYACGAFLFSCTKIGLSHAEALRKIKEAAKQATRDRANARKEEEREREAHAKSFVEDLIYHFLHCSPAEFREVLTRWRGDTRHTLGYTKCMTKLLKHPFTKQLLLDGSGNCECLGGGVSSAMHEITGKFLPVITEKDVPAYGQFEYKLNYQGKEWVIYKFFKQFFKNGGRVRKEYVWRKQ